MSWAAMDKAPLLLVLCVLLFYRRCRSESDPYDVGDDAYSSSYLSPHVYDDELGNYEDVGVAGSGSGGSDFWGGVDIVSEAARFGDRLRTMANEELGIAMFQAAYDARAYTNDASLIDKATQMAHRLQLKLQAYEEALATNRKLVEALLTPQKKLGLASFVTTDRMPAAAIDCCELSSTLLREDLRYAVPVASQIACDLQAPFNASDTSIPRAELTEAFKNNSKRLPGVKWQFFISLKSNVHCEYPAHAFPQHLDGSCQSLVYYRHRDSLLASLRGPRKTMVIMIDNGCSLSDNQMSSAIAVADLLIESLTDTDRVVVLSVANETTHLGALQRCTPPAHLAVTAAARADKQPQSRGSAGQPATAVENYFLHPAADTKQHLRKAVRTVTQAVAMTNHTLAFVTAFGMLQTLFADQSRVKDDDDVSIAYISRGLMSTLSDARQVLSAIQAENARLHARVRIDVYALIDSGKPLIYEGIFLRDIATQNASRFDLGKEAAAVTLPKPPRGRLVNVTSSKDLRAVISSLLPLPAAAGRARTSVQQDAGAAGRSAAASAAAMPYYSALHLDVVDRGPVVTLALPCLDEQSGSAFGVVGMDLRQADLAEDTLYFDSSSDLLYAFIVSKSGQTLAHPMLTRSGSGSGQPGFVSTDVRLLETEPGFTGLFISSISSTPNGTATLNAYGCRDNASSSAFCKPAPLSDAHGSGNPKDHVVTYVWRHVSEQSPFIVVLKQVHLGPLAPVARKLVSTAETATAPVRPEAVVYHRLDMLPTENTCFYFGQLATFDASTFFLSPKAFSNSYDYLHKAETRTSVQNYVAFLRDTSGLISNPGIKEDVRQDVAITATLHKYWLERGKLSKHNAYIARRYVATPRGVARTYPGVALSKAFDPTTTPWYLRASAMPGRLTLVAPRPRSSTAGSSSSSADVGSGTTGPLASICQTLYEGSMLALHTSGDPVAAVIGLDLGAQFLYKWLAEAMPRACGDVTGAGSMRCFLVDDSGYVIAHPHLTKAAASAAGGPVEQNHIAHMEPLLAADLIAHKDFATKKLCNNMADRTMQRYYVFNTSMVGVKQNIKIGDACVRYLITAVPRTNAFLIIVNDTCSPTMPAFCPCSMTDRLCLNCDRAAEQGECECPCECHGRVGHPYGTCDGRATEPAASATADRGGESGNGTAAVSAGRSLRAASASATAAVAVEEDRGLGCWPLAGDDWDGALLALPSQPAWTARTPPCRATPDCSNRTSADACLGVLGCEWCSEQAAAADPSERSPLSRPYCTPHRHCLGGVFRLESVNEDQELLPDSSIGDPLRSPAASAPVGPVAGAVMGTFLLVALGVYCYRHYTSRRDSANAECQRSAIGQDLCIPLASGPDFGRDHQDPASGSVAPAAEAAAVRGHVNLLLLIDQVANVSPYRMNANYRRPHYAAATTTESSDRGYSSLTQADDADDSAASVLNAGAAAAGAADDAVDSNAGSSADCNLSPTGSVSSLAGCAAPTCRSRGGCVAAAECRCSASLESAPLLPQATLPATATSGRRRQGRLQQQQQQKKNVCSSDSGGGSSRGLRAWPGGPSSSGSSGRSVGQYTRLSVAGKADACPQRATLPDAVLVRPSRLASATTGRDYPAEAASAAIQETDVG